ncbi:MAG: phytanoyl-CoA dioxygenase family protein [Acidimicrobiia bacterium]|nr:phytanoyl-CoA dioxygenase family protein [Acidimicrobiia bacterium]
MNESPTTRREPLRLSPEDVPARLPEILDELLVGYGSVVIEQAVTREEVTDQRDRLLALSAREDDKVTHFQGANADKLHLQRRVWNLLNKGDVFERMAQIPAVTMIAAAFLGDEFHMGSIAANRLLPDGPGQEPHIDYPYWDLYKRSSFPMGINSSFPMNLQATILIHDFTEENGATAMVPYSQGTLHYPDDQAAFDRDAARMTGRAGDVVVFNGMCWHCAMPNLSDGDRIGVLIEYLPKFVRPLEDHSVVRSDVVERATPMLRQLLGVDYPYPQVLDEAEAVNAEGRK